MKNSRKKRKTKVDSETLEKASGGATAIEYGLIAAAVAKGITSGGLSSEFNAISTKL